MSETALKFGPEWLRVLSHGGSVSSPPPSPGVNKMKVSGCAFVLGNFKRRTDSKGVGDTSRIFCLASRSPLVCFTAFIVCCGSNLGAPVVKLKTSINYNLGVFV